MNSRRNVLGGLGIGAATLLFEAGCGGEKKRVIGVVPKGRAHLFWQSVQAGAILASRETGVEISWNGPATETDFNGQLQIVDSMINRRVDAICLAPIDKKAMVSVVDRAAAQKIPVIIFDSPVDTDKFVSQVATDNYAAGALAAERMGEILGGKGEVVIVAVQPGAASTMARESGFEETLAKKFPEIKIADKRFGMADYAKSLSVAENMLTAHPNVNGLFASNESSAAGAAQALRGRANSKIKMVGFDSSAPLIEDLRKGLIDSLVVQQPFKMGYESVMAAVNHLGGKPVTKINNLEPKLVSKANVETPEIQALVNPDLKKYLP
jgi:ribose transport system substrate-binding protein